MNSTTAAMRSARSSNTTLRAQATKRRWRSSRAVPMCSMIGVVAGRARPARRGIDNFDAALAIDPNNLGALYNRANALARLGALEDALSPCDRLLSGSPNQIEALNTRGIVVAKLRRSSRP